MKSVSFIQRNTQGHWVGDGFPVRTLFSYNDDPAAFSPFLMLDYGGPVVFEPTTKRRGVGAHPRAHLGTVEAVEGVALDDLGTGALAAEDVPEAAHHGGGAGAGGSGHGDDGVALGHGGVRGGRWVGERSARRRGRA